MGRFWLTMEKEFNLKEKSRETAHKRAKRNHQGKSHWHINKRSNVIICKFCETAIPIWKNPDFCPNCLEGKEN
jgi:rubrerythrin